MTDLAQTHWPKKLHLARRNKLKLINVLQKKSVQSNFCVLLYCIQKKIKFVRLEKILSPCFRKFCNKKENTKKFNFFLKRTVTRKRLVRHHRNYCAVRLQRL